jgi:hypothetical protein
MKISGFVLSSGALLHTPIALRRLPSLCGKDQWLPEKNDYRLQLLTPNLHLPCFDLFQLMPA